jgi:hypothetical protein
MITAFTNAPLCRFALLTLAVLVSATPASAQSVNIVPNVRAGDRFSVEMVHTRRNSSRPQQNATTRSMVDVHVISESPEGFVVDWIPRSSSIDNAAMANDPAMRAAMNAVRDVRFRLTLGPDGELTGVANEAEIAPKLQAMMDGLVKDLSSRLPAEQRATFQSMMKQLLPPQVLIDSATRDATMYFALNGVSLEPGEEVEVDIEQPNILGTGTIPATFRVEMVSATAAAASVETTTSYDAETMRQMTVALVSQAGVKLPPGELEKMPLVEMVDEGRYAFDRTVGLMKQIDITRSIRAGNVERLDSWTIRLVTPPRR